MEPQARFQLNPADAVLVIGASRGIGAALVAALLERGLATVYAASREGTPPVADPRVRPLALDVTDEASLAAAAAGVTEPLTLVIHTPGLLQGEGIRPERRLAEVNLQSLGKSFAVNAFGPILAAKHFLPRLRTDAPAVFASLSARVGSIGDNRLGGWYAYRAAKAAQNQLLRTAAIEAARTHRHRILCALHPGTVATELSAPFRGGVAPEKLFTPAQAAVHLLTVIEGLTPAHSGGFFAWDGQPIPW